MHTILEIVYNGKGTPKQTHSQLLGIVSQLNEFCTIPSQIFTTYTEYIFRNPPHFFQKESVITQYSSSKSVTHLTGLQKEEPGWQV